MNVEEFKKFIESIGFKYNGHYYVYKEYHGVDHLDYQIYRIDLYEYFYYFYNGSEWFDNIYLNDLRPIQEHLKKELRSIKLKGLLG